ncbi:thymidylate synthase [candidate division WWE3 bacterium]|nr:thymidylate synthase [candidate division WWE3 bacterium]
MRYLPYSQRRPDRQYSQLLVEILNSGLWSPAQQGGRTRSRLGCQMRFPLSNGFPIVTVRDLATPFKSGRSILGQALGELCGFLNGARTQEELEQFGCYWWAPWVTEAKCAKRGLEEGDLGPGSYGPVWTAFPTPDGSTFNQFDAMVQQMIELPHLKTHQVVPWFPPYNFRGDGVLQQVVVVPCHGWVNVAVYPELGEFDLVHVQRSADVPVGLVANMIQYAALMLMLEVLTGYHPRELVYMIVNAHVFESQLVAVDKILGVEPVEFPTVTIAEHAQAHSSVRDFRAGDFIVSDYHPVLPVMRIPTPV